MLFVMYRPTTVKNLTELEDIAEEKALKYGDSFLECIVEFCSERDWSTDKLSTSLSVNLDISQVVLMRAYCLMWWFTVCMHMLILLQVFVSTSWPY